MESGEIQAMVRAQLRAAEQRRKFHRLAIVAVLVSIVAGGVTFAVAWRRPDAPPDAPPAASVNPCARVVNSLEIWGVWRCQFPDAVCYMAGNGISCVPAVGEVAP